MKRILGVVLAICIICASLVGCGAAAVESKNAGTAEGKGYASAEDAAAAYLEALKNADVGGMLSTFAIETYVDNFDFEAQLSRIGAYSIAQQPSLPATNDFTRDLNVYRRAGDIALQIGAQYMALFASDLEVLDDGAPVVFDQEAADKEISEITTLLGDPKYVKTLQMLEVVEFIAPGKLDENYLAEANQKNMQKLADIYGADEMVSVAARVAIDGQEFLLCFDAVRYGNKWYLHSLNGNIGTLLGVAPYWGGAMPLQDFDI